MAGRRRPPLCCFCEARHATLSPGRPTKRRLTAATALVLRPHSTALLLPAPPETYEIEADEPREQNLSQRWNLQDSMNRLREAAQEVETLWKSKESRLEKLRKLSNPWPDAKTGPQERPKKVALPDIGPALIPHAVFRETLHKAQTKSEIRRTIRGQLLRCDWPQDIYRIMAVCMNRRDLAENLSSLPEPLMRAIYRCRQNVSDMEVLGCINTIISRLLHGNIPVSQLIIFLALRFAARARSLKDMKRYLRYVRENNLAVSSNIYRTIVAKFSIGYRGLGEIRNGRWKRKELLQVLNGFEDAKHLPPEQQYHFGTFMDRRNWQYLHGWVAVLARCRDSETIWREWQFWEKSKARVQPRELLMKDPTVKMSTKDRGDLWFLEQMAISGDIEKAWKILEATTMDFGSLQSLTKDRLLEYPEFAACLGDRFRDEMLAKYSRELHRIEQAYGIKWVPSKSGEDGDGHHEEFMELDDALDRLGEPDWAMKQHYGFPDDIVTPKDRALHDAEEGPRVDLND